MDLRPILWHKCNEIQTVLFLHFLQSNEQWLVHINRVHQLGFAERCPVDCGLAPVLDRHLVDQCMQQGEVIALNGPRFNSAQVDLSFLRLFGNKRVLSLVGVSIFSLNQVLFKVGLKGKPHQVFFWLSDFVFLSDSLDSFTQGNDELKNIAQSHNAGKFVALTVPNKAVALALLANLSLNCLRDSEIVI
jgi:hypothetical protein